MGYYLTIGRSVESPAIGHNELEKMLNEHPYVFWMDPMEGVKGSWQLDFWSILICKDVTEEEKKVMQAPNLSVRLSWSMSENGFIAAMRSLQGLANDLGMIMFDGESIVTAEESVEVAGNYQRSAGMVKGLIGSLVDL